MWNTASELTGTRFERLTVLKRAPPFPARHVNWLCVCDCGTKVTVTTSNLRNLKTKSCGCLKFETGKAKRVHGKEPARLYRIWMAMTYRCRHHPRYHGRGISVCKAWLTYPTFRDWALANGYTDKLSIDRIKNDGNYTPKNCRWATAKQQNLNRG